MSGPKHTLWRYDPRSGRVWSSEGESIALISPPKGILPPTEPGEALIEWQKRVKPQLAAYEAEKTRRGELLAAAPRLAAELAAWRAWAERWGRDIETSVSVSPITHNELVERLAATNAALREAGMTDDA